MQDPTFFQSRGIIEEAEGEGQQNSNYGGNEASTKYLQTLANSVLDERLTRWRDTLDKTSKEKHRRIAKAYSKNGYSLRLPARDDNKITNHANPSPQPADASKTAPTARNPPNTRERPQRPPRSFNSTPSSRQLDRQRRTEARGSVWAPHGEDSKGESVDSSGSWRWSGKSEEWEWRVSERALFLAILTIRPRAVCTTLGMLTPDQARQLKNAGLSAYNHNLDTSREFYPSVITTRTYDDRLETLQAVRDAGIKVCSGGILGLGEKDEDRVGLIWEVGR